MTVFCCWNSQRLFEKANECKYHIDILGALCRDYSYLHHIWLSSWFLCFSLNFIDRFSEESLVFLSWRKWAIMQLLNRLCRIAGNQLVLCSFQGRPWALVLRGLHASLHCTLIPAQLLALWSPFYTSCTAERWRTSFASCRCSNIRAATFRSSAYLLSVLCFTLVF